MFTSPCKKWCRLRDLNPRQPDYKSGAYAVKTMRLHCKRIARKRLPLQQLQQQARLGCILA